MFAIENGNVVEQVEVDWQAPDERTLGAWNNRIDTTEMGAYACVIAGIEVAMGYLAVRRAETDTGADYYIGPPGSGAEDLEDCYRLEVSGTDTGTERDVRQRVLQKVEQTRRGDSGLPAFAGVVGFSARLIVVADAGAP
jgi:hypothetical protein